MQNKLGNTLLTRTLLKKNGVWAALAVTAGLATAGLATAGLATAGLATAARAQTGMRLSVDGTTASTGVRLIGGRPYVPLADVARLMNGTVARRGSGYAISTGGMRGKIGQTLSNGKWRFTVISVDRAASYDSQFQPNKQSFAPKGDTEELIVVKCHLRNGQTSMQSAILSHEMPQDTALWDTQGASYEPMVFDKRGGETFEGPKMQPGAQTDFAVLFSVPKGMTPKNLVFSLQTYPGRIPGNGTNMRVSLAP